MNIHASPWPIRLLPALAMLAILALAVSPPLYSAAPGESPQQALLVGEELEWFYTRVYGLRGYSLPGGVAVQLSAYSEGRGLLVAAGSAPGLGSLIMGVDLESRRLSWSQALVGDPVELAVDGSTGSWAAVGTSTGEVAVVSLDNPSVRADFYTASRLGVTSLLVWSGGDSPRLVVVDGGGAAYFADPTEEGWVEFSPTGGGGVEKGFHSPPFSAVLGDKIVLQGGRWSLGSTAYLVFGSLQNGSTLSNTADSYYEGLDARVSGLLFYRTPSGAILPATPQEILDSERGVLTRYTLYMASTPAEGLRILVQPSWSGLEGEAGYVDEETGLAVLPSEVLDAFIPASDQTLVFIYTEETYLVDEQGNERLVSTVCYAAEETLDPPPGSSVDLDIVVMDLVSDADSLESCMDILGLEPGVRTLQPLLGMTLESSQAGFDYVADTWMAWLPMPEDLRGGGLEGATVAEVYTPVNPVFEDFSKLLLVGSPQGFLHIYYLDDNGYPASGKPAPQSIFLGGAPTEVEIASGGGVIYVGTSSGHVYMLKYRPDTGLYTVSRSLSVDESPVTSILNLETHIIVASQQGLLQAVDVGRWEPLWRNLPGFQGVETGLDNPVIVSVTAEPAVIASLGGGSIYTFESPGFDLNPIILDFRVVLETVGGAREVGPGDLGLGGGSRAAIRGPGGEVYAVDEEVWERGSITLYVPRGDYTIEVELPGLGKLYREVEVLQPLILDSIEVALREVVVEAVVPATPPSPEYRVAYDLYSGPVGGVELTLAPSQAATEDLGYTPDPLPVATVTGDDGRATAILWSGVEYSVDGSSEVVSRVEGSVAAWGLGPFTVEAVLSLYPLDIVVYDAEAYQAGVAFQVKPSSVEITAPTGRSARVAEPGDSVRIPLPPGSYIIRVEAPGYSPAEAQAEVGRAASLVTVLMEPAYNEVTVRAVLSDPTGLFGGSIKGARIAFTLEEPSLGYRVEVDTGEEGEAQVTLRSGVYRVEVEHHILGKTVYSGVEILSPGPLEIPLPAGASSLSLRLIDGELGVDAPGGFTVTLTYLLTGESRSFVTRSSSFSLEAPEGLYRILVSSLEGYYEDTEASLSLERGAGESVTLSLKPVKIPLLVEAVYNDPTGVAVGGVGDALVVATPLETPVEVASEVQTTDSQGRAVFLLRPGVYEITVTHPYTEGARLEIDLFKASRSGVQVKLGLKPIYGELEVALLDSDLGVELPSALLRITWHGYSQSSQKTLQVEGGTALVRLPFGSYTLEAELPGYYRPSLYSLTLAQDRVFATITLDPVVVEVEVNVYYSHSTAIIGSSKVDLPPSPAGLASVTLRPDDPVLEALGVDPVSVVADETGSAVASVRAGSYIIEAAAGSSVSGSRAFIGEETTAVSISIKPKAYTVDLVGYDQDLGVERGVIEGARAVLIAFNGVTLEEPLEFTLPERAVLPEGVYTLEVSAEGYPGSTVEAAISSPGTVYIPIEPLKVDVAFTVSADVGGSRVPVLWGALYLDHASIEEERPFEVEISQGGGEARLRPGVYRAEYRVSIAGVEVAVDAGSIVVPEEGGGVEVVLKPPLAAVKIAAVDKEFSVRLPEFSVAYIYSGPFGELEGEVEGIGGEAVLQLPPGLATLEVRALGFKPASTTLEIWGDASLEVEMEPIVFGVAIRLADPDGNPVEEEVELILRHTSLPLELRARGEGPILRLEGVRPGSYIAEVKILEENTLLTDTQLRLTVTQEGALLPGVLTVEYRRFTVELWLLDALTGEPIGFPYIVELERQAPEGGFGYSVETVVRGKALLSLPPGTYQARLTPEAGQSFYRVDTTFTFTVDEPGKVELRISPIMYSATILVVDDRGTPQQGALVRVLSEEGVEVASGLTDASGVFTFQAPYGLYILEAEKPGYRESTGTIQIPQSTTLTITLQPGPMVLLQRYGPIAVGFTGLALLAVGLYRVRERIARRLLEEEEYF
ncbi:hypothetical protein APE_0620.1 [Aeropyrum pernix K1]|uniref:PEGA domain-containing protein n=1 Tax=Aeropyrum pernix (strain ATCC 700893 / DSM 11879 / JCM 9820 / NBRC 100138 / K1) TaxID=272557 RepID=Q9YEF6_AERPE|nr:carboxypeptidase regulatory-like domain-containing protein [Aeropyrum pernix]BAA79590.2 hypothetical protein APE_0620.1 [Aeropyrum pernix K1]